MTGRLRIPAQRLACETILAPALRSFLDPYADSGSILRDQVRGARNLRRAMAVFVKAVDAGSFAAAAAHAGSSPQMVATQVAYLEARLATRLLNRTTAGRA